VSRQQLRALDRHYATKRDEHLARVRMEAISEPWRCAYHFRADRAGMTYVVSAATPRELVQRMRTTFLKLQEAQFDVVRLFELPRPPGLER
jgi:hypothetical protein